MLIHLRWTRDEKIAEWSELLLRQLIHGSGSSSSDHIKLVGGCYKAYQICATYSIHNIIENI